MKSVVATLFLASFCLSKAMADGHCDGYTDLFKRFDQGRADCKELADAIVPGEQGCELREEVATTYAYFVCVFSQEYLGWMEEGGKYLWDDVEKEFKDIQVEDELDGIVETCRKEAQDIGRGELEAVAAEILHPGVEVGEQEECWHTFEAETQVKRLYVAVCLSRGIGNNAPAECLPTPPAFLFN